MVALGCKVGKTLALEGRTDSPRNARNVISLEQTRIQCLER